MADHLRVQQQDRGQQQEQGGGGYQVLQRPTDAIKSFIPDHMQKQGGGVSKSKVLAVVSLLPLGGFLLFISGLALTGTLITLALATPLLIIFSPILVPAALAIAMAVAGFLTAGAFGITALSSFSWIFNYIHRFGPVPDMMEQAKQRVQDTAGHMGQKAREAGQKAEGGVGQVGQKAREAGQKAQETVKS